MARLIEVEHALGHAFEPPPSHWDERAVALYALATGAADDPIEERQLRRSFPIGPEGTEPSPGFFATLPLNALAASLKSGQEARTRASGLHYGLDRVLHERHSVEFFEPMGRLLASSGLLVHHARIASIFDTGRHGIVVTEVDSFDDGGERVLRSEVSSLVRSAGGFGGSPRPLEREGEGERESAAPANRAPDVRVEQATRANQALLYRLLGDDNPIHADPKAARTFGLPRPILHGMCTFGFALRHVLDAFGGGDRAHLRAVSVRFVEPVFPGETLVTEAWRDPDDSNVRFQVRVLERDKIVLSHGRARIGAPMSNPVGR